MKWFFFFQHVDEMSQLVCKLSDTVSKGKGIDTVSLGYNTH